MTKPTLKYAPTSKGMLEPLAEFLNDPQINEILINQPQEVYIEKTGIMIRHTIEVLTEQHLNILFQLIASENAQVLNDINPVLSGNLFDGSRVQLIIPPITQFPTLSIRRKVFRDVTLQDYRSTSFYHTASGVNLTNDTSPQLSNDDKKLLALYENNDWYNFIKQAVTFKKTIVISGGTSSGKTTFLNACLHTIPHHERLLILEDTREIHAPHLNQVQLLAMKGDKITINITMQELLQASLRLRPDRIIVGEIRGKEIIDFLGAASTGHEGSMTSLHANNPQVAFMRMTQMYKLNNVPSMTDEDIYRELKTVIDIIIQLEKTAEGRRVQSVYYRYGEKVKSGTSITDCK